MPAARATASVPPTVVAPTARCTTRGGEVARPDLPRVGVEARELVLREADDDLAVEHADRRGHGARLAHLALRLEPDLDALARREAVRDERRLERDDRARAIASRTSSEMRITLAFHLDEARALVRPHLCEAGAAIGAECALVPARDPEPELPRPPFERRVVEPGLDERLRETAARQVRAHPEPEPHFVPLAHEVEEADELAVVADHGAQSLALRRMREQLDLPRIVRRVVPLVRELVLPARDRGSVLIRQWDDLHGNDPTRATQRACALEPAPRGLLERAAEQEACRERVAGAGRVDDVRVDGREVEPCVLGDDDAAARRRA